jgi:chromate transporter
MLKEKRMKEAKNVTINKKIPLPEIFITFLKLGISSFGGPAMIAYIRETAVEKKKWLDDMTVKNGVALCQMIPGASAMQTAAFVGLKTRGISGAATGFAGFGLPSFTIMLVFSILYQEFHGIDKILSIFTGLHAIVIAIIANAVISFGRNLITNWQGAVIAFISASIFFFGINPIIAILLSAIMGMLLLNQRTESPYQQSAERTTTTAKFIVIFLFLIVLSSFILYQLDQKLFNLSLTMLRIDLFAFGGGFASIPLMYHEVVETNHWLDRETFLNGIALGQITPGPIVITATFVGYLFKGLPGALIATVSIFLPSFIMVVLIEPYFNKLHSFKLFNRAINGVLCSFVGLLLSVAVSFALNISWNYIMIIISVIAFLAIYLKVNIVWVVLTGVIISFILL